MKMIGMIGGTSWVPPSKYYKIIHQKGRRETSLTAITANGR